MCELIRKSLPSWNNNEAHVAAEKFCNYMSVQVSNLFMGVDCCVVCGRSFSIQGSSTDGTRAKALPSGRLALKNEACEETCTEAPERY